MKTSGLYTVENGAVCNDSRYATLSSAGKVREAYFRLTGEWCSEAEALAACMSVPNGAPVDMARDNVAPGLVMRELDARDWERDRNSMHRALK